jgi:poly-gamma-glutamate capsule biosynthesis protein CapA/YwtB (metallophosphatase superfamily)
MNRLLATTAAVLLMSTTDASAQPAPAADAGSEDPVTVAVAAVGDIMLGTDYPEHRLADDDGASLLQDPAPIIREADIGFGNLEGVLLDGGEPVKKCSNPSACYLFRSPTRYAAHLADAGFTVMSLANNHARDFGEEGRDSSMTALQANGILHSGREGDVASWEVGGIKVALIAFAPFKGAHDLLNIPAAAGRIRALADSHEIVIVSMHAGGESGDVLRIPFETEYFRGENRGDVVRFARSAVDAGADLVVGHGPHVPRAMEVYQDRIIAYSLGNFATYYGIRVTGDNGLAPLLVAELDAQGKFLGGSLHSFRQRRPEGPVSDTSAEAFRLIERLSREDFPESAPLFLEDGRIAPRASTTAQSSPPD